MTGGAEVKSSKVEAGEDAARDWPGAGGGVSKYPVLRTCAWGAQVRSQSTLHEPCLAQWSQGWASSHSTTACPSGNNTASGQSLDAGRVLRCDFTRKMFAELASTSTEVGTRLLC